MPTASQNKDQNDFKEKPWIANLNNKKFLITKLLELGNILPATGDAANGKNRVAKSSAESLQQCAWNGQICLDRQKYIFKKITDIHTWNCQYVTSNNNMVETSHPR